MYTDVMSYIHCNLQGWSSTSVMCRETHIARLDMVGEGLWLSYSLIKDALYSCSITRILYTSKYQYAIPIPTCNKGACGSATNRQCFVMMSCSVSFKSGLWLAATDITHGMQLLQCGYCRGGILWVRYFRLDIVWRLLLDIYCAWDIVVRDIVWRAQ